MSEIVAIYLKKNIFIICLNTCCKLSKSVYKKCCNVSENVENSLKMLKMLWKSKIVLKMLKVVCKCMMFLIA